MATQTIVATETAPMATSNGDIRAVMNYWPRTASAPETIDLTKPEAEEKFEAQQLQRESIPLTVHNIRGREPSYTLLRNGFQYVHHEVPELDSCKTEDEIRNLLLPATEELVKKVTGAHKTAIFTHRIRSLAEDNNKRADNKAPAHSVHTDLTAAGAQNHTKNVIRDPEELAKLQKGRVMAINVWRPLKPIRKDPLAMLNWASLEAKRDILPNRTIYNAAFWAEMGNVKHDEGHEWCYLEGQTPSEPVVFVQYNSKAEDGMNLPHSAFVDSRWVDAEVRESIEIKMFAFIEE